MIVTSHHYRLICLRQQKETFFLPKKEKTDDEYILECSKRRKGVRREISGKKIALCKMKNAQITAKSNKINNIVKNALFFVLFFFLLSSSTIAVQPTNNTKRKKNHIIHGSTLSIQKAYEK